MIVVHLTKLEAEELLHATWNTLDSASSMERKATFGSKVKENAAWRACAKIKNAILRDRRRTL